MASRVDLLLAAGVTSLALIGVVDAVAVAEPDLAVLFCAIALLAASSVASALGPRRRVGIRADLVAWLQLRADLTGETPEAIADRALAMARVQLGGPDDDLGAREDAGEHARTQAGAGARPQAGAGADAGQGRTGP